jgi:MFS family permease
MGLSEQLRGKNAVLSGNFLVLIITWVLMYSTQPIPDTYSSLYYLSLGATPFLLSVMFFVGSLAIAFVQFPGGYLADKNGRRWLIATMSFGLALGYIFFIFAPSWEFIVLGMVLQNFCLLYTPALMAMMLDSLEPGKRGTGLNFQSVLMSLISLPAPLIAAALVLVNGEYVSPQSDFGMRIAYTVVLAAYLVAAALRVKLKETLPLNGGESRPKILLAFREYPKVVRESWQVWGKVPKSLLDHYRNKQLGCGLPDILRYLRYKRSQNHGFRIRHRHGFHVPEHCHSRGVGGVQDGYWRQKTFPRLGICAIYSCNTDLHSR